VFSNKTNKGDLKIRKRIGNEARGKKREKPVPNIAQQRHGGSGRKAALWPKLPPRLVVAPTCPFTNPRVHSLRSGTAGGFTALRRIIAGHFAMPQR